MIRQCDWGNGVKSERGVKASGDSTLWLQLTIPSATDSKKRSKRPCFSSHSTKFTTILIGVCFWELRLGLFYAQASPDVFIYTYTMADRCGLYWAHILSLIFKIFSCSCMYDRRGCGRCIDW